MTLRVPLEQLAPTVRRVLGSDEVYLTSTRSGSIVTAFSADRGVRIISMVPESPGKVTEQLRKTRLKVQVGQWVAPEETDAEEMPPMPFVVAVAYSTGSVQPGVWVDAFPALPTQAQVLRALYDEFKNTGELDDVAFEEFVRQANPTVVIVSPSELRSYADVKEG
jgi:hypothetical protein